MNELEKDPIREVKYFKSIIYDLVEEFAISNVSTYLAEGMNLVDKAFELYEEDIEKYFLKKKQNEPDSIKVNNMEVILNDIFEICYLRLLNLNNLLPKDDSSVVKPEEEKEYAKVLAGLAESMKLTEINPGNLKDFIHLYLKSGSSKYSFASVPKFDDNEGIDPYADLGDVAPGEEPRPMSSHVNAGYANIEQLIQEAGDSGDLEKEVLLKRIRQYLQLKEFSQNVSQNEAINLMIEKTQKEIDILEEQRLKEKEAEEENLEGEGEDFAQYEQSQPDHSRISRRGETLEERRAKGLREIFGYYAKSQMLIGRKATFEQIQHEISNLNLGEYMKFCKDFKIPCNKVKIAEVFKKIAKNSKELFFEDFKDTLWKLLETRDKEEIDKLKKRLREIKKIMKKKQAPEPKSTQKVIKKKEIVKKDPPKDNPRLDTQVENEEIKDKVENGDSKPQVISRPKGGDPKNVEVIEGIQKEKQEEEELKKEAGITDDKPKPTEDKEKKEEINKKVEAPEIKQVETAIPKKPSARQTESSLKEETELMAERERILKRIEELKAPTEEQYREEILVYIKCDDPKEYKNKNKGFMLPFNTRAKYEDTNRYKFKKKADIENVKREVQRLKEQRIKRKKDEETKKNTIYQRNQNIMKKMHEELLRDKGIYIAPGSTIGAGMPNLGSGMPNPSAYLKQQNKVGYQVPRKFTLEALGRMDYTDFNPPNGTETEDEFKPSDVLDSDEDIDEEIEQLYHFKNPPINHNNYGLGNAKSALSAQHLHDSGLSVDNSQHLSNAGRNNRQGQILVQKQQESMTIPKNVKRKNPLGRVNQSMLPPQKRKNAVPHGRYNYKTSNTPAKKRGNSSIHHGVSTENRNRRKPAPGIYHNKAYKSGHHSVSGNSPGSKVNSKIRIANNKSLVRANQYDARSKAKQEQKLKNILRMHNNKASLRVGGNKHRL